MRTGEGVQNVIHLLAIHPDLSLEDDANALAKHFVGLRAEEDAPRAMTEGIHDQFTVGAIEQYDALRPPVPGVNLRNDLESGTRPILEIGAYDGMRRKYPRGSGLLSA